MESLEPRWVMASPGALDTPTFSGDGLVIDDFGLSRDEEINSVAIQSDGKIIVAGLTAPPGSGARDFLVARYNTDGTRDTLFGTGGFTQINVGGGDLINDVAIDSLGRIVVVGGASNLTNSGFAVVRLTESGQLDTSFAGDGSVFTILKNVSLVDIDSTAHAVALQADGKIVVGGTAQNSTLTTNFDFAVVRYNANGSLDTSFDADGYAITDYFSSGTTGRVDEIRDIAIQSDGKIVAVGFANSATTQDFALARYNSNGTLDNTFDLDGKVTTNVAPLFAISTDTASSVLLEPDGQIVVGGFATIGNSNNIDFIIARYNTNGSLDPTLLPTPGASSAPGTARINMGTSNDIARGLIIQPAPDGKYVLGGEIGADLASTVFGIARVLTNGQLDTTFSGDGMVTTDFPLTDSHRLNDLAMGPDGKIVAVGWVQTTLGTRDVAIARYESGLVVQTISGLADVDEGATYTLNLSSSDPTTSQWTINWGDSIQVVPGNPTSVTHVYADGDASYTISATATTSTGTFAAGNTVAVMVHNVAPTLVISGAADVNEGSIYTLKLSSSDPGSDTLTSWTINWGDGIEVVSGNPASVTHTYADGDASYTISASATDEDGTFATFGNTVDVTVHNVAPTLVISGAADVNEGSIYTLNLSSSDPGSDTLTSWTINWGDGIEVVSGNPASVTHTYADGDASYTISASATDEDGTFATFGNTVDVTVHNVAPTTDDATFSVVENSANGTVVGSVTANDPGADTLAFTIVGASVPAAFAIDSAGQITVDDESLLDFETSPTFTLDVKVTDDDGDFDTATITINLINQASINGVVFVDVNQNGLLEANEPGVDGVTIHLLDELGNPVLDSLGDAITAVTSDGGFYLFDDLDPGVYQLFEMQPSGVTDGAEELGSLGGTIVANDRMQLTLAQTDAFDYAFAEIGQQLSSGDTATIGFWQNKHGQALITGGGSQLAAWLTTNFSNVFGNTLAGASGGDVANFYRDQLFKQQSKKSAGPAKLDAQFMAVALATYFTSSILAGQGAMAYGFNVTDTGIGTKIVNVGTKGAAFGEANGTDLTILQLLQATDGLTDQPDEQLGFASIYDTNGDGVISATEAALRTMANDVFSSINEAGDI